jgi:multidrug resistance efflux pump
MVNEINGKSKGKRRTIILIVVVIIVLAIIGFGVNLWYQNANYVTSNNARFAAPLITVSALNACQIISLEVDLGSPVKQGQRVAEVGQPRVSDPVDRQGSKATPTGRASVEAPVSGYVAAVWAYPGATLIPGQQIITIYDTSNVWVSANIQETQLDRIRPGQNVEVKVDSLGGEILKGTVEGISPATASTFSLLAQNTATGNFIKVIQVVPIKIAIENPSNALLIPGASVEVKIATR